MFTRFLAFVLAMFIAGCGVAPSNVSTQPAHELVIDGPRVSVDKPPSSAPAPFLVHASCGRDCSRWGTLGERAEVCGISDTLAFQAVECWCSMAPGCGAECATWCASWDACIASEDPACMPSQALWARYEMRRARRARGLPAGIATACDACIERDSDGMSTGCRPATLACSLDNASSGCALCADVLAGADPAVLCDGLSSDTWTAYTGCACGAVCGTECAAACIGGMLDIASAAALPLCDSCLHDTIAGCGVQYSACSGA